ncbi:phosphoribosylamine--glycine ligase [Candidatus Woesearchaeota archaeon]|nr:phosphoribosylamine--glycine ligase [Candidatus Woesearchaeota archaeon]
MNVLLIGNGAREHAIAKAIARSKTKPTLFSYMKAKNPGIAELSSDVKIGSYTDLPGIVEYAKAQQADFVVIGPEDPLNNGVVDVLEKEGIQCVGPKKELAQLETSKSFTRNLMKKYDIEGCPDFKVFTRIEGIKDYMDSLPGVVVKPDGLTGGKGVKVQGDHFQTIDEALDYCKEVLEKHSSVIVEEKLEGEEFSLQCFTDGKTVVDSPPAQDHKRAFVDDKGPNTGGMGSYTDADHLLPFLKKEHVEKAHEITIAVAEAIKSETGEQYKGVMYGGWIITRDGVKLIEYNARLGDPEAMNVLPIMTSDYVELCQAIVDGTLENYQISFDKKATVCKYAVPEGYPTDPVRDEKVSLGEVSDAEVFYASVDQKEDGLYMSGSRAIAFVGVGASLDEAEKKAQAALSAVSGKVFFREDIGTKKLIQKRIDHMKALFG